QSFTKILIALLIIGTFISMSIVYQDSNNLAAINFVRGYVFFVFFMVLYIFIIVVRAFRSFRREELIKKSSRFFLRFFLFTLFVFSVNYILKPDQIDFFRASAIGFGSSFGLTYSEIIFFKPKSPLPRDNSYLIK
ncbi:MAG: hypothetical protein GX829_07180, partial [Clostridium sp.]|nr:hypothetical protein [Clostridium sp.]